MLGTAATALLSALDAAGTATTGSLTGGDSTGVMTGAGTVLSSTLLGFGTAVPHSLQKFAVGLKGVPQDLHNFVSVINSV